MKKEKSIPVRRESRAAPDAAPMSAPNAAWARLDAVRDEIDRFFGALEPGRWFSQPLAAIPTPRALVPAMDLTETADSYLVSLELPGVDPAKLEVRLSDGLLLVSAEKEAQSRQDDARMHIRERSWGSFRRALRMPDHVDRDRIEAQYAGGVLTITVPKTAEAKTAERTIKVKAA